MELMLPIDQTKAGFQERFQPSGTKAYVALVHAMSQELGMQLASAIMPDETATLAATVPAYTPEMYDDFVANHLSALGLQDDIDNLEMTIHRTVANIFKKHKHRMSFLSKVNFSQKEAN